MEVRGKQVVPTFTACQMFCAFPYSDDKKSNLNRRYAFLNFMKQKSRESEDFAWHKDVPSSPLVCHETQQDSRKSLPLPRVM